MTLTIAIWIYASRKRQFIHSFIGHNKCARVVDSLYFNSSYTNAYMYSMSSYNLFSTTTIIVVVTFLPVHVIWYHSYEKKEGEKWTYVKKTNENHRE
jgi:hypothetical protein